MRASQKLEVHKRLRTDSGKAKTVKPAGMLVSTQVASGGAKREYFSMEAPSLVWAGAEILGLKDGADVGGDGFLHALLV